MVVARWVGMGAEGGGGERHPPLAPAARACMYSTLVRLPSLLWCGRRVVAPPYMGSRKRDAGASTAACAAPHLPLIGACSGAPRLPVLSAAAGALVQCSCAWRRCERVGASTARSRTSLRRQGQGQARTVAPHSGPAHRHTYGQAGCSCESGTPYRNRKPHIRSCQTWSARG